MSDFSLTLPNQNKGDLEAASKLNASGYLRRIKLMHGIMDEVVQGKANVREMVIGDYKTNLGKSFPAVLIGYRMHAIEFDESNNVVGESFDTDDDEYKRIADRAGQWKKGANQGADWLLWIPGVESFGTAHFARGAFDNGIDAAVYEGQLVTFTSELTGNPKKRQWPIFSVEPLVVKDSDVYAQPSKDAFESAKKQFLAPTLERKADGNGRPR